VMEIIKGANLLLRFLLELCALGAVGYWGIKTGGGMAAKIGLGIGAPLLVASVWAIFVSPRAQVHLSFTLSLVLQVLIFGLAAAAVAATGHRTLAWAFVAVVVINAVLMYVWGQ
jgi:uncharacterized protein DUF2568